MEENVSLSQQESVLLTRVTLANNCPEKEILDEVILGAPCSTLGSPPGSKPGRKHTKAPSSASASSNSSNPAAISKSKPLTTPPSLSTPPTENCTFVRVEGVFQVPSLTNIQCLWGQGNISPRNKHLHTNLPLSYRGKKYMDIKGECLQSCNIFNLPQSHRPG